MMSQFVSDDDNNDGNSSSESGHGRSATDSLLESTTNQPNSGDYRLSNFVSSNVVAEGSLTENSGGLSLPTASMSDAQGHQPAEGAHSAPKLSIADGFEPWHHSLTELGDARRLKDAYGLDVRWVNQQKVWIIYSEDHWHRDESGLVVQQGARQMIDVLRDREVLEERQKQNRLKERRKQEDALQKAMTERRAANSQDDQNDVARLFGAFLASSTPDDNPTSVNERKAWIKKCQSRRGLENMVTLLQAEPGIAINVSELDKNPDLLGVANGVVDLRTGQLRPAGRDDLITRLTATHYDPDATAPTWEQYLEAVLPDPEIRAFLERAMGYSLTGHTHEQHFFILHGDGSTGKTTLIETLRFVFGEYSTGLPESSLTANKHSSDSSYIARLAGARFVSAAETNEFQRMDEALIKRLSGGDTIEARSLYSNPFSFSPTHKIWIATNYLPQVQDTGNGYWRRPILIPFDQKFTGVSDDKHLKDKLKAEAPGILASLVRHCLAWRHQGLNIPPCLVQSVEKYRADQNVVARFIADCCDIGDGLEAPAEPLHQAFRRWADGQGESTVTMAAFGKRLNDLGYLKRETRASRGVLRTGLELRQPQRENG